MLFFKLWIIHTVHLFIYLFFYISSSSRDIRENRKWSVCTAENFDFPAKQDIVLRIKEICNLQHKTPEQMPFKFLKISHLDIEI